jgi:hypothetical protein
MVAHSKLCIKQQETVEGFFLIWILSGEEEPKNHCLGDFQEVNLLQWCTIIASKFPTFDLLVDFGVDTGKLYVHLSDLVTDIYNIEHPVRPRQFNDLDCNWQDFMEHMDTEFRANSARNSNMQQTVQKMFLKWNTLYLSNN